MPGYVGVKIWTCPTRHDITWKINSAFSTSVWIPGKGAGFLLFSVPIWAVCLCFFLLWPCAKWRACYVTMGALYFLSRERVKAHSLTSPLLMLHAAHLILHTFLMFGLDFSSLFLHCLTESFASKVIELYFHLFFSH